MIYTDPTETRARTRLPGSVLKQSTDLPGLEAVTGADLLLTVSGSGLSDVRCLVGFDPQVLSEAATPSAVASLAGVPLPAALTALRFSNACQSGLLVQRKTGRDICSIVPDDHGARILAKMLAWCPQAWLLFVGQLDRAYDGSASVDESTTGFSYEAVRGAVRAWQRHGGLVEERHDDSTVMRWLSLELDRLRVGAKEKILSPPKAQVPIIGLSDTKPWRSTLASFPGCGSELADRLSETADTLTGVLEWITCRDWLNPICLSRPKGIGVERVKKWRRWLGLNEECLQILVAAMPTGYEATVTLTEQNKENETK